jgi:hypothetical protein
MAIHGAELGAKNEKKPRLATSLKDINLEEANHNISVRDGGRNVTVPLAQAVVCARQRKSARGQSCRLFNNAFLLCFKYSN